MIRICALLLSALFVLSGCSLFEPLVQMQAGKIAEQALETRQQDFGDTASRNRDIRESMRGEVMMPPARPGAGLIGEVDVSKVAERNGGTGATRSGTAGNTGRSGQKGLKGAPVRLEFSDTSLKDIIVVFLQDYLKQPYTFEDSFKDKKVNLYFNAEATREDLIALFDTLLENYGARLRYSGGVYMVGASDDKASPYFGPSPIGIGDAVGVFRPNFIDANSFLQLAKQVVKKADKVAALPSNVVVVSSTSTDVRAVAALLADVDLPAFNNKRILVYIPRYISAASLVAVLESYQTQLAGPQSGTKQFEAKQIQDTEKVVIVAASAVARDLVVQFLAQTDIVDANHRRIYQYSLGTQLATELKVNLDLLIKASIKNNAEIVVVPDKSSNSLFIHATPDEFMEIRKLLMRLDYRPPSVQIDVTIAEVNLTENMKYGVEWYLKHSGKWLADATTALGRTATGLGTVAAPSLIAGIVAPNNTYATLQLLGDEASFSLISNPKIVVKNGAIAKVEVGSKEPVAKTTLAPSGTTATQIVEPDYKDIGLKLEVTPFVTQENEVLMKIKLLDSAITRYTLIGGNLVPVMATRNFETELVTGDNKTIFLGGIRRQRSNDVGEKIPGLGDIPYAGALFRNRGTEDQGQELIVFVTPTIILDQQGADTVTNALLKAAKRDFTDPRKKADTAASKQAVTQPVPDAN